MVFIEKCSDKTVNAFARSATKEYPVFELKGSIKDKEKKEGSNWMTVVYEKL